MTAVAATALLFVALLLWRWAATEQAAIGLPRMRVRYDDATAGRSVEQALVSHRYRLAGRPDFVLEDRGRLIPVEAKPGRRAAEPYAGDILQLAAYCLLIEDVLGHRPPYGILRYADRSWDVAFDDDLRAAVVDVLAEMDADAGARDVARSHDEPGRCRGCGLRAGCGDGLG